MVMSNSRAGEGGGRSAGFQYAAAALVLFLALLGSHLATPLYPLWQQRFGLTTSQVTMVFACYPMGVTAGLLFGGRLGDQLGRKPLILVGILLTACSSMVYLAASGMGHLVAARLMNGVAIGLLSGPAVAAIVELHPTGDRSEASRIGAIATLASPAAGLLMATRSRSSAAIARPYCRKTAGAWRTPRLRLRACAFLPRSGRASSSPRSRER
jgi:MFS family permease